MGSINYSNNHGIYEIIEQRHLAKLVGGVRVRDGFLNELTVDLDFKAYGGLVRWRGEEKFDLGYWWER